VGWSMALGPGMPPDPSMRRRSRPDANFQSVNPLLETILGELRKSMGQAVRTNDGLRGIQSELIRYTAQLQPAHRGGTNGELETARRHLKNAVAHIESAMDAIGNATTLGAVVFRELTEVDQPSRRRRFRSP
jgi:hypothetical protein